MTAQEVISPEAQTIREITPVELQKAFDDLLFRWGQEGPDKTVRTEYFLPGPTYGVRIEDRPYERLGRYQLEDGSLRYVLASVIPHNGLKERTLTIGDDKVTFEGQAIEQMGADNQDRTKINGELSSEDMADIYTEVTDPDLVPRRQAVEGHYHQKHYKRGRVGRFIARVRDADRPRYL